MIDSFFSFFHPLFTFQTAEAVKILKEIDLLDDADFPVEEMVRRNFLNKQYRSYFHFFLILSFALLSFQPDQPEPSGAGGGDGGDGDNAGGIGNPKKVIIFCTIEKRIIFISG